MVNRKGGKDKDRKVNIEQHEPYQKQVVNSCAPDG